MNAAQGLISARAWYELAKSQNLTIRELVIKTTLRNPFTGTPASVAEQIAAATADGAADGYVLAGYHNPHGLDEFVDKVGPELQNRGIYRADYQGPTLRDHLWPALARRKPVTPVSILDQGVTSVPAGPAAACVRPSTWPGWPSRSATRATGSPSTTGTRPAPAPPDVRAALDTLDTSGDIAGSPGNVRDQLARLIEHTGADEVMVLSNTYDVTERAACYERLAAIMPDF